MNPVDLDQITMTEISEYVRNEPIDKDKAISRIASYFVYISLETVEAIQIIAHSSLDDAKRDEALSEFRTHRDKASTITIFFFTVPKKTLQNLVDYCGYAILCKKQIKKHGKIIHG